ncbi:hypothetical protein [Clostridium tagluense]|uniref:hypothetical protein n=1 Tax=Clostridium tagluense TaxID=360422 RepID=UPI001C6DFC5F|nr:hypothetical protein [Clostridium tagluense]MBW9159355.1 hypothetical protein [Clostridium tagluense]WLC68070.1 hypothetical protein KTC93_24145 [Clostridium tagluense]
MTQLEVLTLGKKIKKIRKSINATQKDICCHNVDRSYISKIENDKVKGQISRKVAEFIADNINKFIVKNSIDYQLINSSILLENELQQAENIVSKNINYLNLINKCSNCSNEFLIILEETEKIIEKYNVSSIKKYELYKICTVFFYG